MICLLSNVNVNGLSLKASIKRLTNEDVYVPDGYNTWMQNLISGDFLKQEIRFVFIILHGEEIYKNMKLVKESDDILSNYAEIIESFAKNHPEISLFVSTLDVPKCKLSPFIQDNYEKNIMAEWRALMEEKRIPLLELAELVAENGRNSFYSNSLWYLGGMPFSMNGEKILAKEISRAYHAAMGKRKKCLVLDLDNTLWGGVIGEDGLGGIAVGGAKGSCFVDFQHVIKRLKDQGVLLTVVSKNNIEDALLPFKEHPDMVLREPDFVIFKANWNDKSTNILEIANELNIGLDSLVFIDDNPVERAAVKLVLPDVVVPDFPSSAFDLPSFMQDIACEYFPIYKLTEEDLLKTNQYRAENLRQKSKPAYPDISSYLESLHMQLSIERATDITLPRIAQLTQKTNQFNLTTRRYSEADITKIANNAGWLLFLGSLQDRFGSYGHVVLCMAEIVDNQTARIDNFLMSCRVMGRNVEKAFMNHIESKFVEKGITTLIAEYINTPKNSMVSQFWDEMGFLVYKNEDLKKIYTKEISSEINSNTFTAMHQLEIIICD